MLAACRNNTFANMLAAGERGSSGRLGAQAVPTVRHLTNVFEYVYKKQMTWQVGQRLVQLPPRHCSGFFLL
jgi:hypothetical protein